MVESCAVMGSVLLPVYAMIKYHGEETYGRKRLGAYGSRRIVHHGGRSHLSRHKKQKGQTDEA